MRSSDRDNRISTLIGVSMISIITMMYDITILATFLKFVDDINMRVTDTACIA